MSTPPLPEGVHEIFNRAFALHQGNHRDAAKVLYEKVLAIDPRHAHAVHSLGVIASADGRRSEAIEWFQRAIMINGSDAIFYHNLARTLHADGRSTDAVQALRKAVDINPEFLGAWQALAEIQYSLNNTTEAARAIQKVADLQTKTAEVHNRKGLALVKERHLREAVEEFRAGIACNPSGAGLYLNAGNVLSALGEHADAIACLIQAQSLEPKAACVQLALSNAYYRKGDLDAALRARATAWRLDPTLPDDRFEISASPIVANPQRPVLVDGKPTRTTTLRLGQAIQQAIERHNAGDLASAELLYSKVLEVDPVNADALHLFGVLLHQRGDHRAALELIDRVVVRGNASANVYANRASILISLGEFDAAYASGRRAVELDPTHRGAEDNIALAHRKRQEKSSEAAIQANSDHTNLTRLQPGKNEVSPSSFISSADPTQPDSGTDVIGAMYQRAAFAHRKGIIQEAETLYREVLHLDPNHYEALNYLGALLLKKGLLDSAAGLIQRSLSLNSSFAPAHANLSAILLGQRQINDALASSERAMELNPTLPAANHCRGNVLFELGRYQEALADYLRALQFAPNHLHSLLNCSVTLRKLGRPLDALKACDRALLVSPQYAAAHEDRGSALLDLKRYQEALASYRRALEINNDSIEAFKGYGAALLATGNFDSAEKWFRAGITKWPKSAKMYGGLGAVLIQQRRLDEAEQQLEIAVTYDPKMAEPFSNLGTIQSILGRHLEAEACYQKALLLDPGDRNTLLMRGMNLLALGRYTEGWELYDRKNDYGISAGAEFNFPRWRGESLSGKSILVLNEQGYGDDIQFCRYVAILNALGTRQITLVCREALVALLETLDGVSQVRLVGALTSDNSHDYWTSLLSIPRYCRTTLETIPAQLPYLRPDHDRQEFWKARIPDSKFRIGLVWKGNPANTKDGSRSLPSLSILAPLWSVEPSNCLFVSLQKGLGEEEGSNPPTDQPMVHLGHEIQNFADSAAIVSLLDLVICVDTAIGHLTGALRKPCWIMLPDHNADWRWLRDRRDSPWYPQVVRLFRQQRPGDWASVVEELRLALTELLSRQYPDYEK
jgi:tetratricopeptide (TPR) repeat protein